MANQTKKMVAGETVKADGQAPAAAVAGDAVRVRVNPERVRGPEQVVFRGASDGGGDLVVTVGQTADLTPAEWDRVRGEKDEAGRVYLVRE